MANFQRTTLMIAGIVLLICILLVSFLLVGSSNSQVWPPLIPSCPDYWIDLSGNGGACVNPKGLGICNNSNYDENFYMNFTIAPYIGSNGNCAKYQWATNCKLSWDGITYGVGNPCDPSSNTVS